ncbi:MAG: lysozyme [Phenylobacterium sp.]
MKPRHQVSRAAVELIKRFEGYSRKAAQLPDGRWTIGYSHTLTARQGAEVSEDDAQALLLYDLISVAFSVNAWTFAPLSQNQFDALCSFAFNIGLENFRRSEVLRRINEGAMIQAACSMELWRKADFEGERIVIDALVRRRSAEKALFLTPEGDIWVAAPSSIIRPLHDGDGQVTVPQEAPTPLLTVLLDEQLRVFREEEDAEDWPDEAAVVAPPPVPAEEDLVLSPALAAAVDVSTRLHTLFQEEPEPELEAEAEAEPELEAEPEPEPEPEEHQAWPEDDAAPHLIAASDEAAPSQEPLFELTFAEPEEEDAEAVEPLPFRSPRDEEEERGPDLFDARAPANDDQGAPERLAEPRDGVAVALDDASPYEFIPARGHPLPRQPRDGLFRELGLAVLGVIFFGGGIYWALYARPGVDDGVFTPLLVGSLASIAGVGFFSIAVVLMLQRLGRVLERPRDRT